MLEERKGEEKKEKIEKGGGGKRDKNFAVHPSMTRVWTIFEDKTTLGDFYR